MEGLRGWVVVGFWEGKAVVLAEQTVKERIRVER